VGYLPLADADTFVCRTWHDLAARLVWARQQAAPGSHRPMRQRYVDRPLMPSEKARLVEEATRLALSHARPAPRCECPAPRHDEGTCGICGHTLADRVGVT